MRVQPVKCNIMQIFRKRTNKIEASYTLEGMVLENVDSIKYLGVAINTLATCELSSIELLVS